MEAEAARAAVTGVRPLDCRAPHPRRSAPIPAAAPAPTNSRRVIPNLAMVVLSTAEHSRGVRPCLANLEGLTTRPHRRWIYHTGAKQTSADFRRRIHAIT